MKIIPLLLAIFLFTAEVAEARKRFGRSFGSRGKRSFFFKNKKKSPSRVKPTQNREAKQNSFANKNQKQNTMRNNPRPSFMKTMMGAIAGTMIGSMLFRALGLNPANGGGGFLFIILLVIGGFFLFRMARRNSYQNQTVDYSNYNDFSQTPEVSGPQSLNEETTNNEVENEAQNEESVELSFANSEKFKDERAKDFFSIQHAWSKKDLSNVESKMTKEVKDEFQNEIDEMNQKGIASTLENLMIKETNVMSSWNEDVKKFVTLEFKASLIEYETNNSGDVIDGSKTDYTDIKEYWTFSQEAFGDDWKLCAIENFQ